MIFWGSLVLAHAADVDPSRYPVQAEVTLPPTGIVRVHVPLGLRSAEDPVDGSDLLLVNGEGVAIPTARVASDPAPTQWFGAMDDGAAELSWKPTANPDVFEVALGGRAADALLVQLTSDSAADVTVLDPAGQPIGGPTLVWSLEGQQQMVVPLARPARGAATLRLDWHRDRTDFQVGAQVDANHVPSERWTVPLAPPVVLESGWARYDLTLDPILPVRAIELRPAEPLFDRYANVVAPEPTLPVEGAVEYDWAPPMGVGTRVRRVKLGDVDLEQVLISGPFPVTDRLAVLVGGEPAPLAIPEAALELPGVVLLAQDPGPGPFVLYGGAPAGSSPTWDLQTAAFDLERASAAAIEPGAVRANPAYVPREIASGLGAPGSLVELRAMRWGRAVTGAAGFARIALDADVLRHARGDLGDLRLLDSEGRQIPYVLENHGREATWSASEAPFTVQERQGRTWITVELPFDNVLVSSITVRAAAGADGKAAPFSRTVTVARPAGARLDPVRVSQWDGAARSELTLSLRSRFADRLVVEVENGDNPPISVASVDVRWPVWEVLAVLPEGGARLVYGNHKLSAPTYDLAQIAGTPSRRPPLAELAAEEALVPPPLAATDRMLLGVALAALIGGLAWVLLAAIRAVPEPEADAPAVT